MPNKSKRPISNPSAKETASGVPIHCAYTKLADIAELVPNPRNPNKHGDRQIALLAKIIRHQGWRSPIVVSKRSGFVVAGHGRLEAAKLLQVEQVPVDFQDFATEADEWAHLVADNRIAELAEIDQGELAALLKELDGKIDLDLTGFDLNGLEGIELVAVDDKTYTNKIVVPIYTPKGERPNPGELFDRTKTEQLLKEIRETKLPDDVAQFLRFAAERHTVFNFSKIAEFYCHATKDVQNLMEKSAAVIIDYDKAVANGFVHLSNELSALVGAEDTENA